MGVTNADASFEQVSSRDLATAHIGATPGSHRRLPGSAVTHSSPDDAINVASATAVLVVAALALFWFWRWFDRLLTSRLAARIQTVGIQSFEVMRAERIWSALRNALVALRTLTLLDAGAGLHRVRARAVSEDARAVARHARVRARAAAGDRNGLIANIPSLVFLVVLFFVFRLSLRLIRLFFDAIERGTVTLANFDAGVGAADVQDRSPPRDRLRAHRGVSLHSRVGVCGVQRRLALHRHRVLARLLIGHLQHHRRLHDDLPARVQSRGLGEGRCGLWRGDRNASASHASAFDEERRDRHPQLANPRERSA